MADYNLLMGNEEIPMMDMSDEDRAKLMGEWGDWMGGLQEQGKLKGGLPFNPGVAAVISSNKETTNTFYSQGTM